jgi:phenylalanyl-tRNA synthetase beta chain
MPVVTVVRDRLFEEIGKTYDTTEDFEKLCFEFGVELDGESTEQVNFRKTDGAEETKEEVSYKIEVCANRYDLLCLEGLSLSLGVFLGNKAFPDYRVVPPASGSLERMVVKPETKQIRPFVVAAILRNITFTQESYNSFIDLQDKLHENICRRRTLVAIGTHDYDTIEGPFTYEARAPKDIKFKPLNQTQEFDAEALMKHYESDLKLKRFLHIIRSSPVYPVIYDSKGVVLSMPPIINGDHSKIKLETKNVFIECTATDLTKAQIVLDTVLAMFSKYCADPYTVEQVQIEMPDGEKQVEPNWPRVGSAVSVDPAYVNRVVGIDISAEKQAELLTKMCLE